MLNTDNVFRKSIGAAVRRVVGTESKTATNSV